MFHNFLNDRIRRVAYGGTRVRARDKRERQHQDRERIGAGQVAEAGGTRPAGCVCPRGGVPTVAALARSIESTASAIRRANGLMLPWLRLTRTATAKCLSGIRIRYVLTPVPLPYLSTQ